MDPKEKAKKLIAEFREVEEWHNYEYDDHGQQRDWPEKEKLSEFAAKQCALIVVRLERKSLTNLLLKFNVSTSTYAIIEKKILITLDVEKEIEKL